MQNKSINTSSHKNHNLLEENMVISKKVDVNVLLNRVKLEKKSEIKKNLLITAGALGTLALTGLITII
jgi:hypothetical protein